MSKSYDNESWVCISFDRAYSISTKGRVRSVKRGKEHILKTHVNRYGYNQVGLTNEGKVKQYLVHRLVAEHFLINPLNKTQVNHIDGNKQNNSIQNLEWVTPKENIGHAYKLGLKTNETLKLNGIKNAKPVSQIDFLTGNIIRNWSSINEIVRESEGEFDSRAVKRCCTLKKDTHKGYRWRYKGEENLNYERKTTKIKAPVEVDFGNYYEVFESVDDVAEMFGVSRNSVYRAINQNRRLLRKYVVEYA
ncbi:HNH endonuclease [Cytobacillus sp. FSL R7-0696]|uniref:HNH endonuclease n=1 Tax=Cytobacillus sp. FSL R7-0696 TaxID=2921691 RepID=UPI0030F5ABB2